MDGYDEDVTENPFYKALLSKAKPLYNTATDNRWMICIPRKGTTTRTHYVTSQFETHILKPIEGDENNHYQTYNEKEVQISGSVITMTRGFSDVKTVRILFEETFFNPKKESYHILCIEEPLEGGAFSGHVEPVIQNLETLENCIEFLWSGTGTNKRSRKKIDDVISIFDSTYQRLETESIRHAMDAASAVFTRAMQTALKEPHLRRPALNSKAFMDNVKVAIETYVTHGLHKRIFKGLCSFLANQDAELNKITRNLADLQVKDLGVKSQLCKNIPRAKKILSNLNKFTTPLEKLYVLKLTVMSVSEVKDPSDAITVDDLLPVLVFLVVKSEIPNWLGNLTYMYNFHFSKSKNDEFQFYLSSIEAATEYVRSKKLNHLIGLSHAQRQSSLGGLFQRLDSTERAQGPSTVELLFEDIRNGKMDNVLQMLRKGKEISKPLNEQLCHPLCSCDSCEKLMTSKRNDPMAVTVFSRDDMGSTVLHSAAEFDQENILFNLIKLGAVVNATNYHGSTPLHMACLRGHKKSVMMLIHYGANLNAADNDGNLPLHLAAVNGHEKVTEALVLSDDHHNKKLDINAANENGDTPLHIAARWGFAKLVRILLDQGASIEARNKKKETPLNSAANLKIQELITKAGKAEKTEQHNVYVAPSEGSLARDAASTFPGEVVENPRYPDGSPRSIRKKKQLHNLQNVIVDGDVEMLKLKLGISEESDELDYVDTGSPAKGLCHPLCQCSKCSGLQRLTINESISQIVNMPNQDGVTCLHLAAIHGYDRIVSLLLKQAGALSNCRTKDTQKTPLHLACQYNHVSCVSFLLKHGARIDIKDASGNTPLHFCCTNGHISPAILLLQHGANANIPNKRGNTPLHASARWNCPDLISLLLHYGASTKSKNKANLTPLQYAQHDDVIEILQQAEKELDEENPDFFRVKKQQLDSFSPTPDVAYSTIVFNEPKNSAGSEKLIRLDENFHADLQAEAEGFEREGTLDRRVGLRRKQRKTTVAALFEALEEDDVDKLRQMVSDIQSFDRKKRLRHVDTFDKSEPYFDHHLTHMLSIQHFDSSSLHRVKSEDHSDDNVFQADEQIITLDDTTSSDTSEDFAPCYASATSWKQTEHPLGIDGEENSRELLEYTGQKGKVEGKGAGVEDSRAVVEDNLMNVIDVSLGEVEERKTEVEEDKTEVEEDKTEVEKSNSEVEESETDVEKSLNGVDDNKGAPDDEFAGDTIILEDSLLLEDHREESDAMVDAMSEQGKLDIFPIDGDLQGEAPVKLNHSQCNNQNELMNGYNYIDAFEPHHDSNNDSNNRNYNASTNDTPVSSDCNLFDASLISDQNPSCLSNDIYVDKYDDYV
eukprot:gene18918-20822_t